MLKNTSPPSPPVGGVIYDFPTYEKVMRAINFMVIGWARWANF